MCKCVILIREPDEDEAGITDPEGQPVTEAQPADGDSKENQVSLPMK
jgi:hypothetical protein